MKERPRLLCALLLGAASAGAAGLFVLACSSFSETSAEPMPDASNAVDAVDAVDPLDAATAVDAPAPDAGSVDATPDAPAPPFCATAQASADAHVFCADFEDGLSTAWRPQKDVTAWLPEYPEALTLLDGAAPNQPGTTFLQALTPMAADASASLSSGGLVFTTASMNGFHIAFDLRADEVSTPGGVTPFDLKLTPTAGSPTTRIYLTLTATDGEIVISTVGQSDLNMKFAVGFPQYVGQWRHFVLDVGGSMRPVRFTADGFTLVDTTLPAVAPLPASAKLRIGAPFYANGPNRMFWDNLTLDALP